MITARELIDQLLLVPADTPVLATWEGTINNITIEGVQHAIGSKPYFSLYCDDRVFPERWEQ